MRKSPFKRKTPMRRAPVRKGRARVERDPYLDWIAAHECLLCGYPQSDPHHAGLHGHGEKCDDSLVLPLCRACHVVADSPIDFALLYNAEHPGDRIVHFQAWVQEQTAKLNREYGYRMGLDAKAVGYSDGGGI